MGEKKATEFRRLCLLRVESAVRRCLQGEVKELPCSAGLHSVLRVRSPLEDGLGVRWVRSTGNGHGEAPQTHGSGGDAGPLDRLQPCGNCASSAIHPHSNQRSIFHGQPTPGCLIYLSPFLVACPAQGNSTSHWDTSLCPNRRSVLFSCFHCFSLLKCNLAFSAPILCFLQFHHFT